MACLAWMKSMRFVVIIFSSLSNCLLEIFTTIMHFTLTSMIRLDVKPIDKKEKCQLVMYDEKSVLIEYDSNESTNSNKYYQHLIINKRQPEFNWSINEQWFILLSFTFGYCLALVAFGFLASKYGGRRILSVALFVSSTLTILLPVATRHSVYLLITLRFFTGVFAAGIRPGIQSMFAYWIPVDERSKAFGFTVASMFLGNFISLITPHYLCRNYNTNNYYPYPPVGSGNDNYDKYADDDDDGSNNVTTNNYKSWSYVFYIFGSIGIILSCLITWFLTSTPNNNAFIKREEIEHIMNSLDGQVDDSMSSGYFKIPVLKILLSIRIWAVFVLTVISVYSVPTLFLRTSPILTLVDKRAFDILVKIYAFQFIFVAVLGIKGDFMSFLFSSVEASRKVVAGCVMLTQACIFLGLSFYNCRNSSSNGDDGNGKGDSNELSMQVLLLTVFLLIISSLSRLVSYVNCLDIAPAYNALISSVIDCIGIIYANFIQPIIVDNMVKHNWWSEEWHNVFYTWIAVCLFGALFFLFFAHGEAQEWAVKNQNDDDGGDGDHIMLMPIRWQRH